MSDQVGNQNVCFPKTWLILLERQTHSFIDTDQTLINLLKFNPLWVYSVCLELLPADPTDTCELLIILKII